MSWHFLPLYAFWLGVASDPTPLLNLLLRSTLVLFLALLVGRALRPTGPEVRVLIYRASLVSILGIALLSVAPSILLQGAHWNFPLYSSPPSSMSTVQPTLTVPTSSAVAPTNRRQTVSSLIRAPRPKRAATPSVSLGKATARDNRIDTALQGLIMLWPLMTTCLLLRLLWCHLKISWLRHCAEPVGDAKTQELLQVACRVLGVRVPRLLCSAQAHGPFVCGLWRPALVLPTHYATQFDEKALQAIFLHEAAHLRRYDCAWTYLRRVACALFWPQPFLWWLSRQMEVASEDVCDQAVLEAGCAPRDYARCLVDLAESLCLTRTERAVGAGMIPLRSALAYRVEQILKGVPHKSRHLTRQTRHALVVGALGLGAASVAFAVDANTPLGATGTISGRVRYESGKPAPGVTLEVEIQDADELKATHNFSLSLPRRARRMLAQRTTTRADGTYRITGLLAGAAFNVMVTTPAGDAGPSGWVASAQVAKPQPGKNSPVKDLVLTHGALIEGRIEDAVSGRPLPQLSIGCHGPHRPLSTGFISGTTSDSKGRFLLRVPPGTSWVYRNGPVRSLRAEVHFGDSDPYEKELSVIKSGQTLYGDSDFVEVRVDGGAPRYSRSGNGGLGEADAIELQAGQTRRLTFRLSPLHLKERPGKVPLVKLSDVPPVPGTTSLAWNPNAKLPARGTGVLTGRVTYPDGKPAGGVALHIQMQNRAVAALPDVPAVYSSRFDTLPASQRAMLKQNILTRSDGTYRVEGLIDAPYDIVYTPYEAPHPLSQWIARPLSGIQVHQHRTAQAPKMVLQRGAVIRGRITDVQSQQGLPGGFLVVSDGRRPASVAMSELFDADAQGRFAIRVLTGTVKVDLNFMNATFGGHGTVHFGSQVDNFTHTAILVDGKVRKTGSSISLPLRAGQSRTLDFRLPRNLPGRTRRH